MWQIRDWANNIIIFDLDDQTEFDTFEDAEEYLSERLGEDYDTDRQEYEIIEV